MTCRQSRYSSAVVTFARSMSGLEDNQVLSLNHALMQEGANLPADQTRWNAAIDATVEGYRSGVLSTQRAGHDPLARLEAARLETPDGSRVYAAERLVERARAAAAAQEEYITGFARDLGVSVETARGSFSRYFGDASGDSSLRASRTFADGWRGDLGHAALFVDRRSLYAYSLMEADRASSLAGRETRPSVVRQPITSSFIQEIGYDPSTGRAEIVMRSRPEQPYAYRMTQSEWEDFSSSPSVGTYYSRNIRNNNDYAYETAAAADAAGSLSRCPTCGQFADFSSHTCPVPGSRAAVEDDIARTVANASQVAPVASSTPIVADVVYPTLMQNPSVGINYLENGTITVPGFSRIQQDARRFGRIFVPVTANIYADDASGDSERVTGFAVVSYNGRGRGYSVTMLDSNENVTYRTLRCNCDVYLRNYRCTHTDNAIHSLNGLLRGDDRLTIEATRRAAALASEQLAAEYASSVSATEAAAAAFIPLSVDFENNPAEFQTLYKAAREAREEYKAAVARGETPQYPIPYLRENAFGGLAKPGSGRGFGIEVEFAFPSNMSYSEISSAKQRIGHELHAAGLTRSARQGGYGDSHGWVRDHHERGWSFEDDGTTGGSDAISGGEIVSPIMYDQTQTWDNINKVTDVLRRNGAVISKGAGMHVHVSTGDYDHRVENHNRLLSAFAENEDLIYRLSAAPERGGRHRGTSYCAPSTMPAAAYTNVNNARNRHYGHSIGVNLESVSGSGSDHVEFRTFDATLEPAVMQTQIGIAVYLAEAATRPSAADLIPNRNHQPLGTRLAANPRRNVLTGDAWNESTLPVRKFLDKLVPGNSGAPDENPQVKQIVSLFAATKWQKDSSRGY